MNMQELTWHRLFSKSFYKDMKLPMGEMSFLRDFITDTWGDLYPLIRGSEDRHEEIKDNTYHLLSGRAERLLGQYFPYASYEINFCAPSGSCGLFFHIPGSFVSLVCRNNTLCFTADGREEIVPLEDMSQKHTLIVTCRRNNFDVYFVQNGYARYFHTFLSESFADCTAQKVFQKGYVSIYAEGKANILHASFYIDCGVGQADLRPVCCEDGSVLYENGKIYLTFSIRMQADGIQGIFSWIPGTSRLELSGVLFFDCGDGVWRNYIASSLLYHREEQRWYIWTSAFENQVRLAYGSFDGEPRYGINIIDVTLMDPAKEENTYKDFVGFKGDEDPDFFYNKAEDKWYMAICRIDPAIKSYRYAFFTSDNPFTGYQYIGCGMDGAETGGSFITADGDFQFVCGNDFNKRANYRIYNKSGMREAAFDFDDGGFRGWGSVIPVKMGSRTRFFWITFDRHKGSEYNWSYGNIYCFEGIL